MASAKSASNSDFICSWGSLIDRFVEAPTSRLRGSPSPASSTLGLFDQSVDIANRRRVVSFDPLELGAPGLALTL
jgi:hypothetical protein